MLLDSQFDAFRQECDAFRQAFYAFGTRNDRYACIQTVSDFVMKKCKLQKTKTMSEYCDIILVFYW